MASGTGPVSHLKEKPTILIIQGCFQSPDVYKALEDRLQCLGYDTVHALLPTCGDVRNPNFPFLTLHDDAEAVRRNLEQLVECEQKTVMVIMHSYGGLVGSEAILEPMSCFRRSGHGLRGGVFHLFFISAFLLDPSQSMLGAFGVSPNDKIEPDGRYTITNGSFILYNDLPRSEAEEWESQLIPHSYEVQRTKLTSAAYNHIPSTYLICANDQACLPKYQEMFASKAKSKVERCTAGHSPMLSQLDMLVKRIEMALEKAIALEESGRDNS